MVEERRHPSFFYTLGDAKASIVERFNRTLKSRLYRYFTAANTTQYLDILPSLVQRYNEDVHRSIGMVPKDVTVKNEAEVWQRLYGQVTKTRRQSATERTRQDVQERLLTAMDQRSV